MMTEQEAELARIEAARQFERDQVALAQAALKRLAQLGGTPGRHLTSPVTPITEAIGIRNKHILDSLQPGEPILIFRAKDILSTMVLLHYITLLEMYNPHTNIVEAMVEKVDEFRSWQQANPDKVKIPD